MQKQLIAQARRLRKMMTPAERLLWRRLRNREFFGLKFRRQAPIGCFIADFYCHELRLVIEVDGDYHELQPEYDNVRTDSLVRSGYYVLRFSNDAVMSDLEQVLTDVCYFVLWLDGEATEHQDGYRK